MPTLHKFAVLVIGAALLFGLLLPPEAREGERTTVVQPAAQGTEAVPAAAPGGPTASAKPGGKPSAAPSTPPPPPQPASAQAAQAKANELGQVPVIMYHRILAKGGSEIDRTPDELRAELKRLAEANYVPVTAAEFVQGRIDIPAGAHPVVLTFDDGNPTQFTLDAAGSPAPDTAVAILMETQAKYPSFRPVATFFVNKDPFQLGEESNAGVTWLVQHGFEIANHTYTHPNLAGMPGSKVESEIAKAEDVVKKTSGSPSVTFAYPFGNAPRTKDKDNEFVLKGDTWQFQGVFLAGWNPSVSVFSKEFDRSRISRIRSEGKVKKDGCDKFCSTAWLEWLDKNPDKRYTSDGDPSAVTAPSGSISQLASEFADRARVY
ncbi:polysaccharide deacetylase family protein [Actinocorallia sp. B10E7]|uniref:polysaccharide deacetylase family protein n=1 Tax=Actinocorallia sp. B10E7 TaxID=3153558 RepID=UPI00325C39A5